MRFVHQHADYISSADEERYIAQVYAAERPDHSWAAWCVFFPSKGDGFLATDWDTTQSNFDSVRYWASGLTHRYFEGALHRALERERSARVDTHSPDDRLRTSEHLAEAETYAAAAEAARQRAHENEVIQRAMRRGIRFG